MTSVLLSALKIHPGSDFKKVKIIMASDHKSIVPIKVKNFINDKNGVLGLFNINSCIVIS